MATHSDPTANAAIGAVNREMRQMVRRAVSIRKTNRKLTPEEEQLFTGIYRQLLTESPEELEKRNGRE